MHKIRIYLFEAQKRWSKPGNVTFSLKMNRRKKIKKTLDNDGKTV